jgi:hypothetical protein
MFFVPVFQTFYVFIHRKILNKNNCLASRHEVQWLRHWSVSSVLKENRSEASRQAGVNPHFVGRLLGREKAESTNLHVVS